MKTPSGQVHIGALRGVILHDVLHKEFLKEGQKSVYTYIYNDMDPMKKIPSDLVGKGYEADLGKPIFMMKAPEGTKDYARYFADIFTGAFNKMGATPEILFSSEMYKAGKFNDVIKEALDKVENIRKIYSEVAGYEKPENWFPVQVICPKCGKVGTTIVTGWNGKEVEFECRTDLVTWAQGCAYKGSISPFDGNAKLMWKVDWPAHWKVLGVNVEGAGKDHSSAGGSRDMATELCKLFGIQEPADIPYEWFLTKEGSKMSTSSGVGMYAKDLVEVLPPEVARFLVLRTNYNTAILFEPEGETIPDLYDEFDRCATNFYAETPEDADAAKYFDAAIIRDQFKQHNFLPRFRTLSSYIQMPSMDIQKWATDEKGSELTQFEKDILNERIAYAKIWLNTYAPEKYVFMFKTEIPENATKLSDVQKNFLNSVTKLINEKYINSEHTADELQFDIFELTKVVGIPSKEAFKAMYTSLIGKEHGPKAGWLIKDIGYATVNERFEKIWKNSL